MSWIVWLVIVAIWPIGTFDQIGRNNLARKQAQSAYRQGDYQQAAAQFSYLTLHPVQNDATVWLNLGHAYYSMGRYKQARQAYSKYLPQAAGAQAAVAYAQLGAIACVSRDTAGAIDLFRKALITDSENEPARYNFELLKRTYSGHSRRNRQPKSTVKPQTTPQQQEQEVARSPRQEQILRRLRNVNMTEEQANQLLNAMREDDLPLELARRRSASQSQPSKDNRW